MQPAKTKQVGRRTCFHCEATYIEYHKCPDRDLERQAIGLDLELP